MKVLITGAYGYVGLALVQRLAREHEVIAVGRAPRPTAATAIEAAIPEGVERLIWDVRGLTVAGLRKVEAVVHLAGGGASGGQLLNPTLELRDNVDAALHIAASVPAKARRILASSIYVYGATPRPARETDPCSPDTLYGQLKCIAEAVWRQHGGVALRFAHIYGAGSGVDFGRDGVTERLARAVAGGEPFTMHGDGSQRLDLVHIDDACEAVALALRCPDLPPAINIGSGAPVSVASLARLFGVCAEPQGEAGPEVPRALDIGLAGDVLGWSPRVPLVEGARGLMEMFRGSSHECA